MEYIIGLEGELFITHTEELTLRVKSIALLTKKCKVSSWKNIMDLQMLKSDIEKDMLT